jgi:hypothetical protein
MVVQAIYDLLNSGELASITIGRRRFIPAAGHYGLHRHRRDPHTIVETPSFSALWPDYWSEEELGEFCFWLALRPEAGDVIRGSDGCRKVRWSREVQARARVYA